MIHIQSQNIVPDAAYDVRAIACGADPTDPTNFSLPLTINTSEWVDICGISPVTGACSTPPDGIIDINDLLGVVDKFKNTRVSHLKARTDLSSTNQFLNGVDLQISVAEIVNWTERFGGGGYPFAGPQSCP